MPKQCCAVNCSNIFVKGSEVQFYRFPADPEGKVSGAVNRKDWYPTEYTWICSEHFVSGTKSNNPLAPNYVPSLFKHVRSLEKHRLETQMDRFKRAIATRKRRIEETEKSLVVEEQRKKGYVKRRKIEEYRKLMPKED